MKQTNLTNIFLAILVGCLSLYFYIEKQNELTELRLELPHLEKELKKIEENNIRLRYEIDQFESPIHLMELARKPEFSHLKYPRLNEMIIIKVEEEKP